MTILLFIIVLVVLILVHELGHFIVAKLSGMRVDEFGIGYPPRLYGKKFGETLYSVNALPFGGFVKIYGEDETEEGVLASPRAFSARPRILQALTLIAGIAMNLLLAYVLITAILYIGVPRSLAPDQIAFAPDAALTVSDVLPGSPAALAGLTAGDTIQSVALPEETFKGVDPQAFLTFVASDTTGAPLQFSIERNHVPQVVEATPAKGVIPGEPERLALGVSVTPVGTIQVSLLHAPIDGAIYTWEITKQTAIGLADFFWKAITLKADLSQVSGPIGIAGAVGTAYSEGFSQLLSIAAIISINLAIINLLPIPALDGGRLLFVIIESITRRPIKPSFAAAVNGIGFLLLILLMVVVTGHDILKLIH
ncbi:MAG: metalloprotease RseP [Parcubacteria group bacterium]|nr:metalloprotease RseP [Parcubacteria group bacterium]